MKKLRITARPAGGFRRCGVHHPAEPVDHDMDRFTKKEIERLMAEPQLVVHEVDVPEPKSGAKKDDGGKGKE